MKKFSPFFSILCGFLFLASCSPYYYQIQEVSSNLPKHGNGEYYYSDDVCEISYNFWSENGDAGFFVKNNSNHILYINLEKSFFIKNGYAYNYFDNATITNSTSATSYIGATNSVLNIWNKGTSMTSGAISSSIKNLAFKGTIITEQPIVAIPPHASKAISKHVVSNAYYFDCDFNMTPSKKETPTKKFTQEGSPIKFQNYICYYTEDCPTEKFITNDFYVSIIKNVNEKNTNESYIENCNGRKITLKTKIGTDPANLFIIYKNPPKNKSSKKSS